MVNRNTLSECRFLKKDQWTSVQTLSHFFTWKLLKSHMKNINKKGKTFFVKYPILFLAVFEKYPLFLFSCEISSHFFLIAKQEISLEVCTLEFFKGKIIYSAKIFSHFYPSSERLLFTCRQITFTISVRLLYIEKYRKKPIHF